MNELISGKEAFIAALNDENVLWRHIEAEWFPLTKETWWCIEALTSTSFQFKLKPKTIKLGEAEIPASFVPKEGEVFYYIDLEYLDGFNYRKYKSGYPHFCEHLIKLGAWRTEDEIKQVVEVLRGVFNDKS